MNSPGSATYTKNAGAWDEMAVFGRPEYSKAKVNAAGEVLRRAFNDDWQNWDDARWDEYNEALDVINNWRSAHGYPLNTFATTLRTSARRFCHDPLIAQRTKRLFSIAKKLRDQSTMNLAQMQDIGGCRAVMRTVAQVKELQVYYESKIDFLHQGPEKKDYVLNPKPLTGYRGVHLVYRYKTDRDTTAVYNGLKIEMQLRSQYQHAWATAVETVGAFVGQALKSTQGDQDWLDFFKLMGSVIAVRERCPTVPGTPSKRRELREQLEYFASKMDVDQRLQRYSVAVTQIQQRARRRQDHKYFLLQLDPAAEKLTITGFPAWDFPAAQKKYAEAEATARISAGKDAVLVSVDSLTALEKAYPNYFADTRMFALLMNQELAGRTRGISVPPLKIQPPKMAVSAKG